MFTLKFHVSDFSTELLIMTVLSEERNKRKVICLNFFVCFLENKPLMLSLDISRCLPMGWKQSVTAGRRRSSTLLLHFFNQREKKALFWPVRQRRPATTPLQPQPTLSPLRCNRQIKKKKEFPLLQIRRRGDGRSHLPPHVLSTQPPPVLLFPRLLFISSSVFFLLFVKPVKKTVDLD